MDRPLEIPSPQLVRQLQKMAIEDAQHVIEWAEAVHQCEGQDMVDVPGSGGSRQYTWTSAGVHMQHWAKQAAHWGILVLCLTWPGWRPDREPVLQVVGDDDGE